MAGAVEAAAPAVNPVETIAKDFAHTPQGVVTRWLMELELSAKTRKRWMQRCKKIINRYRDKRTDAEDGSDGNTSENIRGRRFNVLWSNTQVALPAIYGRPPKPVVERRYLDRDPVARTACVIIERTVSTIIEQGNFYRCQRQATLDFLLPGQGCVWHRYEPKYEYTTSPVTDPEPEEGEEPEAANDNADGAQANAAGYERVTSETVCTDYVGWEDFACNPARTLDELRWVGKRVYMTRDEMRRRFGREIADDVPLDYTPKNVSPDSLKDKGSLDTMFKRATVWEIWNKDDKKVYWIAAKYNKQPLDVRDDPLGLEGFWPMPELLLATTANDDIVPTPDYVEYQDQAAELDNLTARIAALTKAIKAAGVYDSSVPALQRLLDEGQENVLYPVPTWAAFAQNGGIEGAISMLPIKDMAEVLLRLYEARAHVKTDLYEVSGYSDILRGQADPTGGAKTATEQRIKGQSASARLNDRKAAVATFARGSVRIIAEIVCEHFSPKTLWEMSNYEQYAREQLLPQIRAQEQSQQQAQQQPPQAQPGGQPALPPPSQQQQPNWRPAGGPPMGGGMGHNGGPPMENEEPLPTPLRYQGMVPPPELLEAQQLFMQAVALIKNDKLRGFRIDIEVDSTIEPDQQAEKEARVEFMTGVSAFLEKAIAAGQQMPQLIPMLGKMLLWVIRGFKVGRELEAGFEEMLQRLEIEAANPQQKGPSPDEIQAQAAMLKATADKQRADTEAQQGPEGGQAEALKAQAEIMKLQQEAELAQGKHQLEMEKLAMEAEFKREEHQLKLQALQAQLQAKAQEARINQQNLQTTAAIEQQSLETKAGFEQQSLQNKAQFERDSHNLKMSQTAEEGDMKRGQMQDQIAAERESSAIKLDNYRKTGEQKVAQAKEVGKAKKAKVRGNVKIKIERGPDGRATGAIASAGD